MKKIFLYTVTVFFFCSCNEHKKGSDLICGGNKKYWNWVVNDEKYPGYGSVFLGNGKIMNYYYQGKKRIYYGDSPCVISSHNWEYLSDTSMMMNDGVFKILTLTDEALIIQMKDSVSTLKVIFLKSEDQNSPIIMNHSDE